MINNYTDGKQFYYLDDTEYIGFYHQIRGKYYTGKRHVFNVSKQIIKKIENDQTFYPEAMKFKNIINKYKINYDQIQIIKYPLQITDDQYSNVYILKNKIDNKFVQVTSASYKKFQNHPLYQSFSIKIKNNINFSSVVYNKKQLLKINDYYIRQYISKFRKI